MTWPDFFTDRSVSPMSRWRIGWSTHMRTSAQVAPFTGFVARWSSRPVVEAPADLPADAQPTNLPRARGADLPLMPPKPSVPLVQTSYSLSAPEFLSDPAAAQARSIAVGDVSGDGRDDLVFLSIHRAQDHAESRLEIKVAYQRDDGSLAAAVKIAETDNAFAYQLMVADMDRDGVGDIITTTINGVVVLRSNGDGTFTATTAEVSDPHDVVVTDVDRDGHLDILVDSSNTSATVVHGDGAGGFHRISMLPLPSSAVRAVGDVTGDGLDDLVLATIFGRPLQEIQIHPAMESGGYVQPQLLYLPIDANQPSSLAIGDFNSDGHNDLIVDEAKDHASLHLYVQRSPGELVLDRYIARERGSGLVIATDLDRDGRADFAIAHSGWSYVGFYRQTATGFTPETVIDAYQFSGRKNYFASGDLNHDGCGDLVVSRIAQSPVLMYGRGCTPHMVADCELPPRRVEHPAMQTSGLPPRPVDFHTGDARPDAITAGATSSHAHHPHH